jgi:two-component system sensor histidine kinase/response regulator
VQELIGKPGASLTDPSDPAAVAALAARIERGKSGQSERYEARWLRKDGSELWVYASGTPIYDFNGNHVGNLAMCADVTERRRAEDALRESEADLARAQAVGRIGSWRLDVQRDILSWSDESYRMFGIPPGTPLTYEAFLACVHPEDRDAVDRAWQAGLRGEPYSIDHRIILGGDVRWIHEQAELDFDESGGLLGGFGTCQDITDRKRAEEALRESEERLRLAQRSAKVGVWDWEIDRDVLYFTPELNEIYGLAPGTIKTYDDWRSLAHPDDIERVEATRDQAIAGHEPFDLEFRIQHSSGEIRWISAMGSAAYDDSGRPIRVLGVNIDVTARKQAGEVLRLQANALQAAANGIVITDNHGAIQWVNGAFTRLTGYSVEEATGQNPRVLKSGQHDAAFYDKLWKTILSGRVWQGEIVNKRKDGRLYIEEMTITPVRDDDGQIAHFIAIKQDITERKRLAAELEKTRSEFLGEVSHELKTPLTAIKGCASMALSSPIPPDAAETRELFDIIDAQANRLADLVANLLDVTRIEGGRLSIEPTTSDLAGIVEEARVIFEHSQYPHPLEVMLPRALPMLRADGRRVVQVLTNLFTNAAKYSAPTTPIIVTAEKGEGEVTVHVRDAGVGIAADKMPLLFRKFVQVQERGAKGTGLGLFICKGIVEAHGGRIWAESAGKGKGTVFSFTLPAVAGKMAPKHKGVAAGRGGVGRRAAERPIRVVAVDDELDILHYIEHCLRSANCEVVSTSDPLAAAELVRFHAPDIVLLDMRMPGMSGLDVLEEIRKFCQTPVTFITATQNREDVVRGREFGGTTWLEKPFSPQQLLDHVALVLARRRRR